MGIEIEKIRKMIDELQPIKDLTVKKNSSYQNRLEDLKFAWEKLSEIKEVLISRMDGLTDLTCLQDIENIVYELFDVDEEQMNECPLCGRFARHSHPEL